MRKLSFLLAFLLALTAVCPVHAAAAATEMRSEIALVDVTVPAVGRIVLNPYGLPVEVDGEKTTEQIASETMPITNSGDEAVVVTASVAGRISEHSSMTFVSAPPAADTVEKEVFLYTEFQREGEDWSGRYSGGENQILVTEGVSESKEVLTLEANAGGKFRMFGATAVSPADPWSGADEISVTVVFTFTPLAGSVDLGPVEEEKPAEDTEPADDPTEDASVETPEDPTDPEPETPEAPDTPEVPETPEDPETPAVPETPEDPDTPVVPETPEEPETPAVPETPDVPETPAVPETPGEVELPEEPETPEAETPEGSETPEVPETP